MNEAMSVSRTGWQILFIEIIRVHALKWEPAEEVKCLFYFSSVRLSLVILDVVRYYLWLFTLYINIKIGKNSC